MAALDLQCGVDRVWGGDAVDMLDSFDSEMQQWEEQLQEMQQKIEELYKMVEARRSANDSSPDLNTHLNITLLPVTNTISYPQTAYRGANNHNAFSYHGDYPGPRGGGGCDDSGSDLYGVNHTGGPDVTLDILDGYLGLKPNSSPRGNPSLTDLWSETDRIGCSSPGEVEEAENRRNSSVRHVSWQEPVSGAHRPLSKPNKQKERHAHFPDVPHHPDRKCPVIDRKCASPSVLRKFEAMLQENEGKTLTDGGMVTPLASRSVPTRSTTARGQQRASKRTPVQKCLKDSDVPVRFEHRRGKSIVPPFVQTAELQSDFQLAERILGNCAVPQYPVKNHGLVNQRNESPASSRRGFSRPARPANQRPPSRWASHAPAPQITAPLGPRSRSLSPACKSPRRFGSDAETVIM